VQYLLFYAEIIDKNRKNHAYADLGHITEVQMMQLDHINGWVQPFKNFQMCFIAIVKQNKKRIKKNK